MAKFIILKLLVFLTFLLSSTALLAQNTDFPTVKFTQELWTLNPPRYSVRVNSVGNGHYESTPNSTQQTGENYVLEFNVSAANKNKIFHDLESLNFFKTSIDDVTPGDGGTRSLIYMYGDKQTTASYHATSNPTAQQLTALFQSISATMETARRINKLHLEKDPSLNFAINRMLARAQAGELAELQAVAPVLQSIVADTTVPPETRTQTQAILKLAGQ
jgi:hypothetical protein